MKVVDQLNSEYLTDFWSRPQTPRLPLPYQVKEVEYKCAKSGHTLHATLTLPKKIRGSLVFVPGFGVKDRDSTISGHKLFFVLSDFFTKLGFSTLRYEFPWDSSVSCASGEGVILQEDFAASSIQFLRSHSGGPIIGFGHSCGGRAILSLSHSTDLIDGCILMSTPITSLFSTLVYQHNCFVQEFDLSEAQENLLYKQLVSPFISGESVGFFCPHHKQEEVSSISEAYKDLMSFSLEGYVASVEVPVLYLYGMNDCQVDVQSQLDILNIIAKKKNTDLISYPDLNHLLQPSEIKSVSEYRMTRTTISELVFRDIRLWFQDQGLSN